MKLESKSIGTYSKRLLYVSLDFDQVPYYAFTGWVGFPPFHSPFCIFTRFNYQGAGGEENDKECQILRW